jgi:hypothetical protein
MIDKKESEKKAFQVTANSSKDFPNFRKYLYPK